VTGGASGIGRATARVLAAAGAYVLVGDIDEKGSGETCAQIRDAGGRAEPLPLDVTDADSVDAFAGSVGARTQRVYGLVNGVGWDRYELFLDNTPEYWEQVVQINYLGMLRVTRAFLPAMVEAREGKIVNVASDAGRVGSLGETVYAGAKGGVIAFTKSLAREMARHQVNVNCVCPGPTDTPLFRALPEKMQTALERAIPFRRLAQPQEVAEAIAFFAGPGSDFITGQVLSVSGGLTMSG
jgi:2-hydroxycyclohexanecarboxyl-CoA dehydrogenase